jgi:hypothetical protein
MDPTRTSKRRNSEPYFFLKNEFKFLAPLADLVDVSAFFDTAGTLFIGTSSSFTFGTTSSLSEADSHEE